jgi:chemotaxis protein MotB
MARRKKEAAHENHERWLVSYADFITLLFAFFVVMFASSQTDKSRAKQISEAVEKALADGKTMGVPPSVAKILGGTVDDIGQGNAQMRGPGGSKKSAMPNPPENVIELTPSLRKLTNELEKEIKAGSVEVNLEPRGLVVSLKQTAFFPSGTDAIDPSTYPILEKVADAVNAVSNPLRIEGHTDSVPIHTTRFRSNWELSAARSISMMEVMASRFNVDRQRVAIVGFADTAPQTSNDTEDGRARNRRVDIVIQNNYMAAPASINAALKNTRPPSVPGQVAK